MPDIPQEYIDFMERLKSVMDDASKASSSLADHNKDLKKTQDSIMKAIKAGIPIAKGLSDHYKKLKKETDSYKNALKSLGNEEKKDISLAAKIKKAKLDIAKAYDNGAKNVKKEQKALQELLVVQAKSNAAIKRATAHAMAYSSKMGLAKTTLDTFTKATKAAVGGVSKFIGVMGLTTISYTGIAKAGMDYDRTLFSLARTQQVAGKGSKDFSVALDDIAQRSSLARDEFAQLANTFIKGFLGIKPSLTEFADLQLIVAKQVGPELESQKAAWEGLRSVQNQFPSLYEDIISNMALMEKIRSGQGTAAEEKRLAIAKETIAIQMTNAGMSQEQLETVAQLTSDVVAADEKYLETLRARQEVNKQLKETQLAFYEDLKPMMIGAMKMVTGVIQLMNDWRGSIIFAAKAIGVLKVAQMGFNLTAWANPYVAIAASILAGVAAIATLIKAQRGANQEAEKMKKAQTVTQKIERDRLTLSKEQIRRYDEAWKKEKDSVITEDERLQKHKDIISRVQEEAEDTTKLVYRYGQIKKDVEERVKLVDKVLGGLKSELDLIERFGGVNEKILRDTIKLSEVKVGEQAKSLKGAMDTISKSYEGGIDIDVNARVGDQATQMKDFLLLQTESAVTELDRKKAFQDLTLLMAEQKSYKDAEISQTEAQISLDSARVRQQEEFTNAYEDRLNTERQLMESAQFGLGASVEMMQKQVDLSYTLMQNYEKMDQQMQNNVASWGKVNSAQMESIKNARTQEEAQATIDSIVGLTATEYSYLTNYAVQHQKNTKKIMDQQQKIYELTKDVREGYLDAIREMSVGAGEFEKIIGTQEMGVTQLMGAVKGVTGLDALNTMALGGLQEQSLTAAGVGTDLTGKYGKNGLEFIGGAQQDLRNNRLYKYGEYEAQAKAAMRGEVVGGPPAVGSGVAGGAEPQYIRPFQEEVSANAQGTLEALNAWSGRKGKKDFTDAVNRGVKEGKFSSGEVAALNAGGATGAGAAGLGAAYLNMAKGTRGAGGGYTTAPGPMNIPGALPGQDIFSRGTRSGNRIAGAKFGGARNARKTRSSTAEEVARYVPPQLPGIPKGVSAEEWKEITALRQGGKNITGKTINSGITESEANIKLALQEEMRIREDLVKLSEQQAEAEKVGSKYSEYQYQEILAEKSFSEDQLDIAEKKTQKARDLAAAYKQALPYIRQAQDYEIKQKEIKSQAEQDARISKDTEQRRLRKAEKIYEARGVRDPVTGKRKQYGMPSDEDVHKEAIERAKKQHGVGARFYNEKGIGSRGLTPEWFSMGETAQKEAISQEEVNVRAKYQAIQRQRKNQEIRKIMGGGAGGRKSYDQEMKERAAEYQKIGILETGSGNRNTSAQQKAGFESSAEFQKEYNKQSSQREAMYGLSGETGSGGGGAIVVTINLGSGLQAKIDNCVGAIAQLNQAS